MWWPLHVKINQLITAILISVTLTPKSTWVRCLMAQIAHRRLVLLSSSKAFNWISQQGHCPADKINTDAYESSVSLQNKKSSSITDQTPQRKGNFLKMFKGISKVKEPWSTCSSTLRVNWGHLPVYKAWGVWPLLPLGKFLFIYLKGRTYNADLTPNQSKGTIYLTGPIN